MFLDDGSGDGFKAKVDGDKRLHTRALRISQQHEVSSVARQAYQVIGNTAIAASEKTMLLLKNTSTTKELVVSYIRLETIGAAAANASAYWTIYMNGDYSSGGTAVTPVNMYGKSPNAAAGTFYDGSGSAIVTSGTKGAIDITHRVEEMIRYSKEGSLILPQNGVLSISFTGSTAAGTARARVSFYYADPES